MSRKIIVIVGIIFVVAILGIFAFYEIFVSGNPNRGSISGLAPGTGSTNTLSPVYHIPSSTTLSFGTPNGTVTLNNFYAKALGADEELVVIRQNPDYGIAFDTDTNVFEIAIVQGTFSQVQAQAEQDFMATLGVDQADACKLKVAETVAPSVDPAIVGKSLPLSFCGGGF